MVDAKWCHDNLNSDRIRFTNVLSEIKEVLQSTSRSELVEELGDVLYFTYCWLYSRFGINLKMKGAMGSVNKFIKRLDIWKEIFRTNGLEFNTKYLVNGSNYEKRYKVLMALYLAINDQSSQQKQTL